MNKDSFVHKVREAYEEKEGLYREFLLSKLREEVYSFLLSRTDEDEYYDFFNKSDLEKELILVVGKELEEGGWKQQLGFGGSALFVFKGEPPRTCWG